MKKTWWRRTLAWSVAALIVMTGGFFGAVWWVNNVEHPTYRIVIQDNTIEVRDYDPMVVAEVVRNGERSTAVNAGFRPLAAYIFAKERDGERIAMTAPVTQSRTGTNREWAVRFVMPNAYALDDLPASSRDDVRLSRLTASRRAVIRFSGVATDDLVARKEAELRAWIAARGLQTRGSPTIAYYNAPITPGFLRRNEVMIDIISG